MNLELVRDAIDEALEWASPQNSPSALRRKLMRCSDELWGIPEDLGPMAEPIVGITLPSAYEHKDRMALWREAPHENLSIELLKDEVLDPTPSTYRRVAVALQITRIHAHWEVCAIRNFWREQLNMPALPDIPFSAQLA